MNYWGGRAAINVNILSLEFVPYCRYTAAIPTVYSVSYLFALLFNTSQFAMGI